MLRIAEINGIGGIPELAKALGYKSAEKLYRLKRPGNSPSFDIIVDLTNKFEGMDVRWLITGEGLETDDKGYVSIVEDPKVNLGKVVPTDINKMYISISEANNLREENARLKIEVDVLRSALREIGAGRESK